MVISNTSNPNSDFQIFINHNLVDKTNNVKYLGVYLNTDLSWKLIQTILQKNCQKFVA